MRPVAAGIGNRVGAGADSSELSVGAVRGFEAVGLDSGGLVWTTGCVMQ